MTSRGLALVWCAAIALGAATALALVWFRPASVVVIGSSLLQMAIPPAGAGSTSLLGDGREHFRLAIPAITEEQTVTLLNIVLKTDVQTVFIEANALAFNFASYRPAPDHGGIRPVVLMQSLLMLSHRARESLIALLGVSKLNQEEQKLDAVFLVGANQLSSLYPLQLRYPRNPQALKEVLRTAAGRGIDVILIAPPRSQLAADAMGSQATETLGRHFQALAQQLGLPLFQPAAAWSNDHFIDQAHMNRRGRVRFMRELAQWWATRP